MAVSGGLGEGPPDLLGRVLEGLPFGAVVIDHALNIVTANGLAHRLLEIKPDRLATGAPLQAVIEDLILRGGEGDPAAVAQIMSQIGTDGDSFNQRTPSGATLAISFRAIDGERLMTIEDRDSGASRARGAGTVGPSIA